MGNAKRVLIAVLGLAATLVAQAPPPDARMMRGDDVRWADPNYDDSHWERIPAKRFTRWEEWRENRLWIRSRLEIPRDPERWTLVVRCQCEVYLNGKSLGHGTPKDNTSSRPVLLWLPPDTRAGPALLAVRYRLFPGHELIAAQWRSGNFTLVPRESLVPTLEQLTRRSYSAYLVCLVLLAMLASLWGQRFDPLAKWICAYLVLAGPVILPSQQDWGLNLLARFAWAPIFAAPLRAIVLAVLALLVGVPLRAWWFGPFLALVAVSRGMYVTVLLSESPPGWTPLAIYLYQFPAVVELGLGICFLYKARRLDWERRLLISIALLTVLSSLLGRVTIGSLVIPGGVRELRGTASWDAIASQAFAVLAVVFLIRRSRERKAEEARMRGELEAARSVQSLLLGQSLPAGIEAVYLPASEVGGDFYQCWGTAAGTMLVVGDVSGKGMPAAMTVSTIIGALRAFRNLPPAELLAALNQMLVGHGGFVTCCCVLASADGLRIANAGQPAPYLDGEEFAVEPGLPLGIVADTAYAEASAVRPAILTLVSDGVIEAANASGELLGFERAQALMGKPAKEVAEAARVWGQTDDITVVRLRRS